MNKIRSFNENSFILFLLCVLAILIIFSSWQSVIRQNRHFTYDEFNYYEISLIISNKLFFSDYNIDHGVFNVEQYKAPFYPLLSSIGFFIFGASQQIAIIPNFLFLFILLFTLYYFEIEIFGKTNKFPISPILFIIILPKVFVLFPDNWPNFTSFTLIALSMLLLIQFKFPFSKGQAILFGLIIGIGQITRLNFFSYLVIPAGYIFWKNRSQINIKKNWENFLLIFYTFSFIVLPWYILNYSYLFKIYPASYLTNQGFLFTDINGSFFDGVRYFSSYIGNSLSILLIPFLLSAVFLIIRYKRLPVKLKQVFIFSLCNIFFIILFYSLFTNKQDIYMQPLFIFIVLIISLGIKSLFSNKRFIAVVFFFLVIFSGYMAISHFEKRLVQDDGIKEIKNYISGLSGNYSIYVLSDAEYEELAFSLKEEIYLKRFNGKSLFCSAFYEPIMLKSNNNGYYVIFINNFSEKNWPIGNAEWELNKFFNKQLQELKKYQEKKLILNVSYSNKNYLVWDII